MKRVVTGAANLVALVLAICAVMGFLLLGTRGTWHAEMHVPAGHSAVVVEPALASVIGPRISLHAETERSVSLFIGRARPDDAEALLGDSDRFVITGMQGARQLEGRSDRGSATMPAPAAVDIWQSRSTGDRETRISYYASPGAQSAVIARADGGPLPALTVSLAWSDRAWYWIPSTLLIVALGLGLLVRRWNRPSPTGGRVPPVSARRRRPVAEQRSGERAKHVGRRRAQPAGRQR